MSDAEARVDAAAAWGADRLPAEEGRDLPAILAAAASGRLGGLVVGGVDLRDLPDPALAREAVAAAGFLVQLEVRRSEVTEHADVVLPVAPPVEKGGTYLNWEGRRRPFGQVLVSHHMSDHRVLDALAAELGVALGCATLDDVHAQLTELAGWQPAQAPVPAGVTADAVPAPGTGQAVLATWKLMLDDGRGQDGEPHLAGTAHRPVVRLSAARAAQLGAVDGASVTVRGPAGSISLPLAVTTMSDDVVWLPENSPGSHVHEMLGAGAGALVDLEVTR